MAMYKMAGSRTSAGGTRMRTERKRKLELEKSRAIKKRGPKSSFHLLKIMKMKILLETGEEFTGEVISWDDKEEEEKRLWSKSSSPEHYCELVNEMLKNYVLIKLEGETK
jgi:hypothetical protein